MKSPFFDAFIFALRHLGINFLRRTFAFQIPSVWVKMCMRWHMFFANHRIEKKLLTNGFHLGTFAPSNHRILKRLQKVCHNSVAEASTDIPQSKKLLEDGTNLDPEASTDILQSKKLLKDGTSPASQAFRHHRICYKPSLECTNRQDSQTLKCLAPSPTTNGSV